MKAAPPLKVFPLGELPRDVLVDSLGLLGAVDLACGNAASRFFFLVAREVQRRPELVVEIGEPGSVLSSLRRRLTATPTMGFLFGTGDLDSPELAQALAERLPLGCQVVGASTPMLQALAPPTGSEDRASAAARSSELRKVADNDQITLMLGAFPDAMAQAFHLSAERCAEIAGVGTDAEAAAALQRMGLPTGGEWKTVVLLPSGLDAQLFNFERLLNAYQRSCRNAAIIGGIAVGSLLLHTGGETRVVRGVVGFAIRGDVPLTALVSRGCTPVTPVLRAQGARITTTPQDDESFILIPKLLNEGGTEVEPIEVAIQAQRPAGGMLFAGVRLQPEGGYMLEQLSNQCFLPSGAMRMPLVGAADDAGSVVAAEGNAREEGRALHCEVRLFKLSPEACKTDLQQLLSYVRQQCEDNNEQVLGAIMFTCGGRTQRFFGEDCADAKRFQEAFPTLPLIGFWAGGEIGPQAFAQAAPAQATRTGNAALQGFTAVFGIFRAPKPARGTLLAMLGDDELAGEVGAALARLARDAKERGNSAFRLADLGAAELHYTRAIALAAVPSSAMPTEERATFFANRAAVRLKARGGLDAARQDAEAACALDSMNAKAHYRLAQALLGLGRSNEAIAGLRCAVAKMPGEAVLADLLAKSERRAAQ